MVLVVCLVGAQSTESLSMTPSERRLLDFISRGFFGAFALECVLKVLALGPRGYFFSAQTQLELACLALALVGVAANVDTSVVFLVRLFGVFRVVGWNDAAHMVRRLVRALPLAAGSFWLFLLFILGCAIIGRELFAGFYSAPPPLPQLFHRAVGRGGSV